MVHTNVHIICKALAVKTISHIWIKKQYYSVSKYSLGFKYCDKCDEWFFMRDITCACCNATLRTRTKSLEGKEIAIESAMLVQQLEYRIAPKPKYHLSNIDFENAQTELQRLIDINNTHYPRNDPPRDPAVNRAYYLKSLNTPKVRILKFINSVDQLEKRILTQRRETVYRTRRSRIRDNTGFRNFMNIVEQS